MEHTPYIQNSFFEENITKRMKPRICRCCGGQIWEGATGANDNLCADCERFLEDDSPSIVAEAATDELSLEALKSEPPPHPTLTDQPQSTEKSA